MKYTYFCFFISVFVAQAVQAVTDEATSSYNPFTKVEALGNGEYERLFKDSVVDTVSRERMLIEIRDKIRNSTYIEMAEILEAPKAVNGGHEIHVQVYEFMNIPKPDEFVLQYPYHANFYLDESETYTFGNKFDPTYTGNGMFINFSDSIIGVSESSVFRRHNGIALGGGNIIATNSSGDTLIHFGKYLLPFNIEGDGIDNSITMQEFREMITEYSVSIQPNGRRATSVLPKTGIFALPHSIIGKRKNQTISPFFQFFAR